MIEYALALVVLAALHPYAVLAVCLVLIAFIIGLGPYAGSER